MLIFILVQVFVSIVASVTHENSPNPRLSALVKERTKFYANLIALLTKENFQKITEICDKTDETKLLCTNSEIDFKQLVKSVIHLQQTTGVKNIFKYSDPKSSVDKKTESKLRMFKLAARDREEAGKDFENEIADMLKRINDLKTGVTLEKRGLPNGGSIPVAELVTGDGSPHNLKQAEANVVENAITAAPEDTPEVYETNAVETTVHEGERLPAAETTGEGEKNWPETRRKTATAIWYGLAAVLTGTLGAGIYLAGFAIAWATIYAGFLATVGPTVAVIGTIRFIGCDGLSHCLATEIADPIFNCIRSVTKKYYYPACVFPGKWLLGLSRESFERMKQAVMENA